MKHHLLAIDRIELIKFKFTILICLFGSQLFNCYCTHSPQPVHQKHSTLFIFFRNIHPYLFIRSWRSLQIRYTFTPTHLLDTHSPLLIYYVYQEKFQPTRLLEPTRLLNLKKKSSLLAYQSLIVYQRVKSISGPGSELVT